MHHIDIIVAIQIVTLSCDNDIMAFIAITFPEFKASNNIHEIVPRVIMMSHTV